MKYRNGNTFDIKELKFGIISLSTSRKEVKYDFSGKELKKRITNEGWSVVFYSLIPDSEEKLIKTYDEALSLKELDIIITSGGTGLSKSDITVKTTKGIAEKELFGMSTLIINYGLKKTKRAALSNPFVCTVKDKLIINLPGSVQGVIDGFNAVKNILPHSTAILKNEIYQHNND